MMTIKDRLPWQLRIIAKLVLSRLPLNYSSWSKVTLFKHGLMEKPDYAYGVVINHFDKFALSEREDNFVVLELGPGDSLFSALIAYTFGASCVYLIDIDNFAKKDLQPYFNMAHYLRERGLKPPRIDKVKTIPELLEACNARYMTAGISSLHSIPDQSVDFIWSQAVLEHVKRSEFSETMSEFRRIIRNDGLSSHAIDLRDHLGGALNNLRFSKRFWESNFISKSGFYTNRIRYIEMLQIFKAMGFEAQTTEVSRWESLPTPRNKLSADFSKFSDDELCLSVFDVILRPI